MPAMDLQPIRAISIKPPKKKNAGVLVEADMAKKFIQKAIKHPGALRKSLHVKKGEKISEAQLEKAEHSKNPKTAKRAHLAETLKKLHKGK
jgi:hypothetical protein